MSESTKRFDCELVAIDKVLSFLPREDAGCGADRSDTTGTDGTGELEAFELGAAF